jgi:phage-related protein
MSVAPRGPYAKEFENIGCDGFGDTETGQKFINTIGIMADTVGQQNKTAGFSLVASNIVANLMYTVLQIVAVIMLIWYVFTYILEVIKARLSQIDWLFELIQKIWTIVSGVVKETLEAIKRAIDGIKGVIDKIKAWFDNFSLGDLSKKILGKLCFWC